MYCHGGSSSTEPTSMTGNSSAMMLHSSCACPSSGYLRTLNSTHLITSYGTDCSRGNVWVLTTYEYVEDDILWVHLQDLRKGPAGDISADWGRYELIAADPRVDGVGGEVIFWVVGDTTSGWRSTSGGGGDDAGPPSCILHHRSIIP